MSLQSSTRSITDITARAFGAMLPQRSILATDATGTGVQSATGEGGEPRPGGLHYPGARTLHTVNLAGTFSATAQVEGSQDNQTFSALTPTFILAGTASGASLTAAGVYAYQGSYRSLRLNITAYTSGALSSDIESAKG